VSKHYGLKDDSSSFLYITRIEEEKEETELDDITNYVPDASPSGFFKRAHPDEAFLDTPAKVTFCLRQCISDGNSLFCFRKRSLKCLEA